jgi:GntR family transcriptional regulator/MocR family aminotransferase
MQLTIPLSRSKEPLFQQVHRAVQGAILGGALCPGERLPSTRELAAQLKISRTVVVRAYEYLLAEGFITGRGGSGTYVSEGMTAQVARRLRQPARLRLSRFGSTVTKSMATVDTPLRKTVVPRYNFIYGRSDLDTFPFASWRRMMLRQARKGSMREFDYGSALGNTELRAAISAHLRRSRGVVCSPSQVIVVNGSQQALDLVIRLLVDPGDTVAIEDPHYDGTREALRAAGAQLRPVPVDKQGLDTAQLPVDARLVFVTPSHQFPSGTVLTLDRRLMLLQWARRCNAVIVEDDYGSEFHYGDERLQSLQGMDPDGRTVYIGTFSRTMFASLRIGYLVAPASLVSAFTAAKWLSDLHSASLEQQTLAEFIMCGMYERHLQRLRRRNAVLRSVMLNAVEKYLGDRVEVTGEAAGAQITLWPKNRVSEESVVAAAASRGVGLYGIAHCFLRQPSQPGFLLGYARLTERDIREGIRLLGQVL